MVNTATAVLAVAAALAAPAATQAFMFGSPCSYGISSAGIAQAQAAMKAVAKFQPKVENTAEAVKFSFPAEQQGDVDAQMQGSYLSIDFKRTGEMLMWPGVTAGGSMKRAFCVPADVDTEAMSSSWQDGVFTVSLPKKVRDAAKARSDSSSNNEQQQRPQQTTSASTAEAPRSTADYLQSLGANASSRQRSSSSTSSRDTSSSRPKATGTSSRSRATSGTSQQQQQRDVAPDAAAAAASFDKMLTDMFGVPSGFASSWMAANTPTPEQMQQWESMRQEQAQKRSEAYAAARRSGMAVDWSGSTAEAYKIAVELPQGVRAPAVRLTQSEGNGVTITLSAGDSSSSSQQQQQQQQRRRQRRVQLPRDARNSDVKAKFVREKEGEDLVLRVEITAPRAQPQPINVEMA